MYTHEEGSRPQAWNRSQVSTASTPQYSALYFSYSSNLSPQTMKGRHPHSLFAGLAVLPKWRFHINTLRFANIVPSDHDGDVVYGALYFITAHDEAGLDDMESAPTYYQKRHLEVTRVDGKGVAMGQEVEALVYVDSVRVEDGTVDPAYVVWLRKAVRDARPFGLPQEYVEKCIRPWVPEGEGEEEERDMVPVRVMFSRDAFT